VVFSFPRPFCVVSVIAAVISFAADMPGAPYYAEPFPVARPLLPPSRPPRRGRAEPLP
jgi:hypothetical protein